VFKAVDAPLAPADLQWRPAPGYDSSDAPDGLDYSSITSPKTCVFMINASGEPPRAGH